MYLWYFVTALLETHKVGQVAYEATEISWTRFTQNLSPSPYS